MNPPALPSRTLCLAHQLPENRPSPLGLVCADCHAEILRNPPQGRCLACWESQPAAYTRDRRPLFVYTLIWNNFRIRSLHPFENGSLPETLSNSALQPTRL